MYIISYSLMLFLLVVFSSVYKFVIAVCRLQHRQQHTHTHICVIKCVKLNLIKNNEEIAKAQKNGFVNTLHVEYAFFALTSIVRDAGKCNLSRMGKNCRFVVFSKKSFLFVYQMQISKHKSLIIFNNKCGFTDEHVSLQSELNCAHWGRKETFKIFILQHTKSEQRSIR